VWCGVVGGGVGWVVCRGGGQSLTADIRIRIVEDYYCIKIRLHKQLPAASSRFYAMDCDVHVILG